MIIHIEVVGTPKDTIQEAADAVSMVKVTPGSQNFLGNDEQLRVRKLLDSLKSHEEKNVETQTEDTSELRKYSEESVEQNVSTLAAAALR